MLKADKKILSRLSDQKDNKNERTLSKEPYKEPVKHIISKKVDDRYQIPPKQPETDWSPDAVTRRADTTDREQ